MPFSLTFLGGAGNVTGSCTLLDVDGRRLLLDCGLFQERHLRDRNYQPFAIPPRELDAILLTHAHLDHCGLLPKLVKEGFQGPVFATPATAEIARIVLLDAAKLQAEDIAFKKKRHAKEGRRSPYPYEPLYTSEEVETACTQFRPIAYLEEFFPTTNARAAFFEGGHILGSSMIRLLASPDRLDRTFLFSGDVGRWNRPLINDPSLFSFADYLQCETTYGDREHVSDEDVNGELARLINETRQAGGHIVIPSFAVERTQELLYRISALVRDGRIPIMPVYLDSPMAIAVTEIFRRHPDLLDKATRRRLANGDDPFRFPGLRPTPTSDESKQINESKESAIIIAGSGMCTGGRIKHHLRHNLPRPESLILFAGFQARETLGRLLVDGAREVRLFGEMVPVKARIARLHGLSAHADRQELLCWLSALRQPPRTLFLVHGEPEASQAFAEFVAERLKWPVYVPSTGETVSLT